MENTHSQSSQGAKVGPKDFFLYLAAMVSLYMSVGSLIGLLFGIIDFTNPDRLDYAYAVGFYTGGMRFAIATLIIIFPVYLIISWLLRKDIVGNPLKANLWVRRWFIFITLFLAGGTIVGDLIAVVNTFLGGEISSRFLLKVLVVLVVAAAVFLYYWYDLRRTARGDMSMKPILAIVAGVAVLAAVVGGIAVAGTPGEQRQIRFDQERISDLQSIQWEVVNYYQSKAQLPQTLGQLNDPIRGFSVPRDPATDASYDYERTGNRTFELCATFARESEGEMPSYARFVGGVESESWAHPEGSYCFERTIDPDFFPVREGLQVR